MMLNLFYRQSHVALGHMNKLHLVNRCGKNKTKQNAVMAFDDVISQQSFGWKQWKDIINTKY